MAERLYLMTKANRREPMSDREVGLMVGVSRQRVWKLEQKAIAKIRKALGAVAGRSGV